MTTGKLIYVVEDEGDICTLVCGELERYGHHARAFRTGAQAMYALRQQLPDVCIIDLGLPDMDGLSLVRHLTEACETGVIILSGRNSATDKVLGLELGADDYVSKPFDPRELVARTNSFLRRRQKMSTLTTPVPAKCALFGDWSFDPATLTATHRSGTRETLSAAEAELLLGLLQSPRQILSREQLMNERLGSFDRCIDVRMSRIRKKLEQDPRNPQLIRTVYGAGYMLSAEVQWQSV
ncbi:MAG TPA: response regulator transcription factor [Thiolinea sp.]|nr:response regulator transcription factor [Thiolinea sp.]